MSTPTVDPFVTPLGRALRCFYEAPGYERVPVIDADECDETEVTGHEIAAPTNSVIRRTDSPTGPDKDTVSSQASLRDICKVRGGKGVPPVPDRMSRPELEARVDALRRTSVCGEPYTRHKIDFSAEVGLKYRSGKRRLDEAYSLVKRAARQYVDEADRKPITVQRVSEMGVGEFCKSYVPGMLQRGFEKLWFEDVNVSFYKVFSVNGDANLEMSRMRQLEVHSERQRWATTILRTLSLDMSGALKSNVLLQGVDSIIKSDQTYRADRHTRFLEYARSWKLPTHDEVLKGVKADSESTHPELASFRHLVASSLRGMVRSLGATQFDPSVSSASRDKLAHGLRHIINLKDFQHVAQHVAPDLQALRDKIGGCEPKQVITLFDVMTYMTDLRDYAGHDIIGTLPMYTSLSGNFKESFYYCEGVGYEGYAEYFEQIGEGSTSGVFRNQKAWDFTENDVVYIPNRSGSGFGIYNVVKHVRPDINRQVVMLCIASWHNIPFSVAERLVFEAHGVKLGDMFSEPGPCRNVSVVNGDSSHPILVMNTVKGHERVVYTRYQKETSPKGTATVLPPLLRHLEHLHQQGGRTVGLSSREHLQRLQSSLEEHGYLPGGKLDPIDNTSLLELLRVVGVPENLPPAVYYNTEERCNVVFFEAEEYMKENPGESGPTESRTAKAVPQVPNIVESGPTYGTLAPDDVALKKATEAHLGEGNTKEQGPNLQKLCTFATKYFLDSMAEHSGVSRGSLEVVTRDAVLEKRTRPSQRNNEVSYGYGPGGEDELGRAFTKNGEHAKVKEAARMINSMEQGLSIDSGRLGKTLDILLKKDCGTHGVDWYCPGMNPTELSNALQDQYIHSGWVRGKFGGGRIPQVDYEAADDSHTKDTYELLKDIIEYFFSSVYCADLAMSHAEWGVKTLQACFNIRVRVGPRVKNTKWKNPSGTGITTHINSIRFAFRSYLTIVISLVFKQLTDNAGMIQGLPVDDSGKSDPVAGGKGDCIHRGVWHEQIRKLQESGIIAKAYPYYDSADWSFYKRFGGTFATLGVCEVRQVKSTPKTPVMRLLFDAIGLKLGDDGVECSIPGVPDETWLAASKYLDAADGFKRKVTFSDPNLDEEVEFLSRIYPNLNESRVSYTKIERAAQKLAVSANADKNKYRNKLLGYMVTDRFTPIIGAYITAIWAFKDMGELPDWLAKLGPAKYASGDFTVPEEFIASVEDRELAWKLNAGPYPVGNGDLEHMYENAAKAYQYTSGELMAYDESLRQQTTWEGIKRHTLPPSLAILTAELSGEYPTRTLPAGAAMVEPFPAAAHLFNAPPASVTRRSEEILSIMIDCGHNPAN